MADRPIRNRRVTKFSQSMWCDDEKEVGDVIEYEGKEYKVLTCSMKFDPPVIGVYTYYLTISEV